MKNYTRKIAAIMTEHSLTVKFEAEAVKHAIKAGKLISELKASLYVERIPWVAWIRKNIDMSQRNVYNYEKCYLRSLENPAQAAACRSIRELLGESLAGKSYRVIEKTKLQRALLLVAEEFLPDLKAQALIHAINGTDPKTSALQSMTVDWAYMLQLSPAIA
jgi:hypothetical protein